MWTSDKWFANTRRFRTTETEKEKQQEGGELNKVSTIPCRTVARVLEKIEQPGTQCALEGRGPARNIRGRRYSKCRVKCNLQPRRWLFIRWFSLSSLHVPVANCARNRENKLSPPATTTIAYTASHGVTSNGAATRRKRRAFDSPFSVPVGPDAIQRIFSYRELHSLPFHLLLADTCDDSLSPFTRLSSRASPPSRFFSRLL